VAFALQDQFKFCPKQRIIHLSDNFLERLDIQPHIDIDNLVMQLTGDRGRRRILRNLEALIELADDRLRFALLGVRRTIGEGQRSCLEQSP